MTAEVAILNKVAVALAADSAVTISAPPNGNRRESRKIYNTQHKLFPLSVHDALGIMINNDMHFMEVPLPVIIGDYRRQCRSFPTVEDAAADFRSYLLREAKKAPAAVKLRHLKRHVYDLVKGLNGTIKHTVNRVMSEQYKTAQYEGSTQETFFEAIDAVVSEQIETFQLTLAAREPFEVVGEAIKLTASDKKAISSVVRDMDAVGVSEVHKSTISNVIVDNVDRLLVHALTTGIVIAGLGSKELFPTLVSFDLCGFFGGCVRYSPKEKVDIDRNGDRAAVLAFAQQEMVERFMYGIDQTTLDRIVEPVQEALTEIRTFLLDQIELSAEHRARLENAAKTAEDAIHKGWISKVLKGIVADTQHEIEGVVEFMPKSELAEMAEALINFTSIKRRVSSAEETVGGPIDVAVISKSEGFVWVRHKHYFPGGLNAAYFARTSHESNRSRERTYE